MNILDNQKFRIYMFLERCLLFPNYKILMYVHDIETADKIMDEIMEHYKTKCEKLGENFCDYSEIYCEKITNDDVDFAYPYTGIQLPNGSYIMIAPVESKMNEQAAHAVMFDTQIPRHLLEDELKPTILVYEMPQGSQMCNPRILHLHTRPNI